MAVEQRALVCERLGPTPDVPVVGVTRGDLERHLLAAAADHQLGMRTLRRLGRERRLAQLVVTALERRLVLRPEGLEHLARFIEPRETLGHRVEGNAVRLVLVLLPRGADATDEPAARDDVHLRGHLRQHRRMPIGVARHDRADAQARHARRERRQRRPALHRVADAIRRVRHEVIGDAGGVPAAGRRVAPELEHRVPRRVAHPREDSKAHLDLPCRSWWRRVLRGPRRVGRAVALGRLHFDPAARAHTVVIEPATLGAFGVVTPELGGCVRLGDLHPLFVGVAPGARDGDANDEKPERTHDASHCAALYRV